MLKYPNREDKVPALNQAIEIARDLERRERWRIPDRSAARANLANRLRVGVGTVENIIRGRIKRIDADLRDRIHELLIRELENEIAQLTHKLAVARLVAERPDHPEVFAAEAHLVAARELLSKATS